MLVSSQSSLFLAGKERKDGASTLRAPLMAAATQLSPTSVLFGLQMHTSKLVALTTHQALDVRRGTQCHLEAIPHRLWFATGQ